MASRSTTAFQLLSWDVCWKKGGNLGLVMCAQLLRWASFGGEVCPHLPVPEGFCVGELRLKL